MKTKSKPYSSINKINKPARLSFKKIQLNSKKHQGQKSLLEKISTNIISDQQNIVNGKLVITKLNDYNQEKCMYSFNCSHLRAQGKCQFLHEKKDYQHLSIALPQKYLQNQQPIKKSKLQRKQDKIKQKAERQKRLNEKLQRQQTRNKNQQKVQQSGSNKIKQQKQLDYKQLFIQKLLKKSTEEKYLNIIDIYSRLNLITDAICLQAQNQYSEDLNNLNISLFQVRKRLLMKLKKNKQFQYLLKSFIQKQGGFVRKIIKNVFNSATQLLTQIQNLEKWNILNLTQIQQNFNFDQMNRVLHSRKQNKQIIEYYLRFFKSNYGFPVSFDPFQNSQNQQITSKSLSKNQNQERKKGNLITLTDFNLLLLISPSYQFKRILVTSTSSFEQYEALTQFSSLIIPELLLQNSPIQKVFAIDMSSINYNKFVNKLVSNFSLDYYQKMKGVGKQFQFGKIEENLKRFRSFIGKYKSKIQSLNKNNSFVLIVYNIRDLLQKIQTLGLQEHLQYDSIKKDRSLQEENCYEKIFLLRQFIKLISQGDQNILKVVYVDSKKLKVKKYKSMLGQIDQGLKQTSPQVQVENS